MDWIAIPLTMLGSWLVVRKDWRCFVAWLAANGCWITWSLYQPRIVYSMILMNVFYAVMNVRGIHTWRKAHGSS